MYTRLTGSLILLSVLLASCVKNPVTGKRQLAISEKSELALGAQSDPQIVASMGLYEDAELQALIQRLGGEMAKDSHRPNLAYEFKIVDSDVVNAFAVPGGYVYFTRGILAHFNNEAEFAGVLGHELGHVTARHSAQQIRKQQVAQVGMIAGALASNTVRQNFESVNQGMQMLFLKYGRDAETEADALGVEYSTEQGYDAEYMAGFFRTIDRLQKAAGAEVPDFLSTHPNPVNREANVRELAAEWQRKLPGEETEVGRERYLNLIDGLLYGEDPAQGYTENGRFYHPELKFVFDVPSGWQLINSPQQVQLGSPEGDAMVSFAIAQGDSPEAAAQAFLQQYKLQATSAGGTEINGLDAYVVAARVPASQQQPALSIESTLIAYAGSIYQFLSVTVADKARAYAGVLRQPAGSFRELNEAKYLDRKPERIKIRTVDKATTLAAFLTANGIPADRHAELAILNGMELDDRLAANSLIKTVERS